VSDSRRLSQAISEGDGISILVEVRDVGEVEHAAAGGADGLVLRGLVEVAPGGVGLPVLVYGPSLRDAADAGADAVVVAAVEDAGDMVSAVDLAASLGLEPVLRVCDEDDLERVLEHLDPEIVLLCGDEADEDESRIDRLLALLHDVPAGKLAIAELGTATRADVDELERAGIDAVVVSGDAAPLAGDDPPEV
jgi:indole-3-glycerol phosphate synthase